MSLKQLVDTRFLASLYLVVTYVQIVAVEGYTVSPIKVGLMALTPLIFLSESRYLNKALIYKHSLYDGRKVANQYTLIWQYIPDYLIPSRIEPYTEGRNIFMVSYKNLFAI